MVKTTKIITPVGIASWCALNPDSPDTKFDPQWHVKLIVEKDEAATFVETAKAFYQETRAHFGMDKATNPIPISAYVDEEGNATDKLLIKCKRMSSGVKKDGTPWTNSPHVLFGADLKPFVPEGRIGKGTRLRVALAMSPYGAPKVGVKFDIISAQILDAEYYEEQASPDDFNVEEGTAATAASPGVEDFSPAGTGGGDFNF